MKKLSLLISAAAFIMTPLQKEVRATDPITAPIAVALIGAGITVATPIIIAVATPLLVGVKNGISATVRSLTGSKLKCSICNAAGCSTLEKTFEFCKSSCQAKTTAAGFELKIRYADDWSVASCVAKGNAKYKNTQTGPGIQQSMTSLNSIAIYSDQDLQWIEQMIAALQAADQIIDAGGYIAGVGPDDRAVVVAQARKARAAIATGIQARAAWGYLGPQ